ncbi:MAG: DUF4407 domain-containing protein [Waterburya sp.]
MKEQLNFLEKILLWSSGADHRILAQEECLTERYKHSAIGMTVLLTATMAVFSGGYALFTVFASLPTSIIGGSFWGLIIFNLDRFFILSSKRKKSNSQLTFYTATSLRLLIALLLSFVVAKPLELRLFEHEINRELKKERLIEQRTEFNDLEQGLKIQEKGLQESKQEKKELYNDWQKAEKNANEEAEGTGGTRNTGKGIVYLEKRELANSLRQQFEQIDNDVQQQQQEVSEFRRSLEDNLEQSQSNLNQTERESGMELGSFLDRLVALEKLSDENSTIRTINLLITTLFIIIEISPVLVKTISGKGSYDVLLEQQETHGIYNGYLREQKDQKLQEAVKVLDDYLKSIIDFEQEIEERKEKYFKLKEKSRESLNNRNIKNIRENIDKKHTQELIRFLDFCDKEMENYLNLISDDLKNYSNVVKNLNQKMVDSGISDSVIKKWINQYTEDKKVEEK